MNQLLVINQGGRLLVDSREVAEMTGKRHTDLIRDIDGYKAVLDQNANLRSDHFFIESSYEAGTGKSYRHFLLTKKGCDMVANKMTGEKGVLFTATYVTEFEEMEKRLNQVVNLVGLSPELQAIFTLDKRTQAFEDRVEKLENKTTIDYGQQRELKKLGNARVVKLLGGKGSAAYRNSSIRSSVYSALWNDYQEYFGINSYNNTLNKDYESGLQYVPRWTPPNNLMREIEDKNLQISFI
ncbi:Rha family transcriptional regulator [Paenibacillus crassostreae]|uniref:Rha family transcriptional regulator n=1 Tax=Paenibacillus crassostreae TaxID=1763538 RepID=UPI00083981F9|nr:ORF6C domain-containing protein [Paenibacillus crassostreae]AOZ91608.1 hypothetical protein LPB68_04840 [Paenibacillus crassostreae]